MLSGLYWPLLGPQICPIMGSGAIGAAITDQVSAAVSLAVGNINAGCPLTTVFIESNIVGLN